MLAQRVTLKGCREMLDHTTSDDLRRRDLLLQAAGFGVALCAAATAYAAVYLPLDRVRAHQERAVRACEAFLSRGDAIRAEHQQLTERLAATESRMSSLLARIPETPREAEFLAELHELAGETELAIHDYRPGDVRPSEGCSELAVQVQAEGTYASLCRFLQGLERLERFCRLSELGIAVQPHDAARITVQMTLKIFCASRTDITNNQAAARTP